MARNKTTIVVTNRTGSALVKIDQGHNDGRFDSEPREEIPPGDRDRFGSIETTDAGGDDGFVIYDIGGFGRAFWTVHWINPEQGISQAVGSLSGEDAERFDETGEMLPEGGDIEAVFTVTDATLTLNDFLGSKPPEADEPTLRFGDQSADGWVEYLQQLLNFKGHPVAETGVFDQPTFDAVTAFQDRMNRTPNTPSTGQVVVDGIVGNQTWALLREEDARPPSTDGLEPHTFVEAGLEARWLTENSAFLFFEEDDRLIVQGVSTGDAPIQSGQFQARFLVVLPNADAVVRDRPIFTPDGQPAQPGQLILAEFVGAAERSRNVDNTLGVNAFSFQVFMPDELGGDTTQSLSVPFSP